MDGNALRYKPLVVELAPVMRTSCGLQADFDTNAVKAAIGSGPRSDLGIWRLRRAGTTKKSGYVPAQLLLASPNVNDCRHGRVISCGSGGSLSSKSMSNLHWTKLCACCKIGKYSDRYTVFKVREVNCAHGRLTFDGAYSSRITERSRGTSCNGKMLGGCGSSISAN